MSTRKVFVQALIFVLSIMSVSAAQSALGISNQVGNETHDVDYERNQLLIIRHLRDTSNCKTLVNLSDPNAFRTLNLNLNPHDGPESSMAILQFLERPERQLFRDSVREIIISSSYSRFNWTLLDTVFSFGFKNLEIIRWDAERAISPAILGSLEMHSPSAKLYYTLSFQYLEPVSGDGLVAIGVIGEEFEHGKRDAARRSILNSSNLYSIKSEILYGGRPNRDDLRLVWQVLTSCPNVKELELSLDWGGCLASDGQAHSFDFHSNPGVRLPPLEVLKLKGYDFLTTDNRQWSDAWQDLEYNKQIVASWRGSVERTLNRLFAHHPFHWSRPIQMSSKDAPWQPAESSITNLQNWVEAMDWSKLHTLHLSQASMKVVELLRGPSLPSLKHFTFEHWWSVPADMLVDFLLDTPLPLESINLKCVTLNSSDKLLSAIGERHGGALKNLRLTKAHDREIGDFLSMASIDKLRDSCSNIESLSIDLEYSQKWDYELLHALVSFPQLRHLSFHLVIPYSNQDPSSMDEIEWEYYQKKPCPFLINYSSAPGLFRYLRKHKIGQELEKLEIHNVLYGRIYPDWYLSEQRRDHPSSISCFVDEYGLEVCN